MLAHQHGLALITEKLQNQRLEEPAGGSSGVAPSGGSSTSSSFCGKLPAVSQDSFLISDHPGQSATALSVKGKNVWTLSLEADRTSQHGVHHHHSDTTSYGSPSALHMSSSPRSIAPSSVCRHKKLRHLCQICDTAPGTPSAPPKKKHCRSLSVPPDGPSTPTFFPSGKDSSVSPCTRFSIGIGGGHGSGGGHGHGHSSHHSHHYHHHHHHQTSSSSCHHSSSNSKIWRPIAVVPLRGSTTVSASNNNNTGISSGSSSNSCSSNKINSGGKTKGGKERIITNTGLHYHHHPHYPPANFSHTVSATNDDNNNNNNSSISSSILTSVSGIHENNNNNIDNVDNNNVASSSISSRISSCSSSGLQKHKLMPPSSSSSASFDSGHFTTSDLQTPPSSPIPQPRPASAASDASYSSTGWFDFSPMRGRLNILQNRSLSCEDRISACSSCCSSSSPFSCSSSSTSGTTASMPCVYNSSNPMNPISGDNDGDAASGSGAAGRVGDDGGGGNSNRGSVGGCCPHHHHHHHHSGGGSVGEVVPRCHSQPCVLHHRRCGKKRRRDCDRPTLNFNKMTETAYVPPHPHRRSEPWSQVYDAQMRFWQGSDRNVFNNSGQNQQNQFYLNPIASSPRDPSDLLLSRHLQQQQQIADGRIDLRPERRGQCVDSAMTISLTPPEVSPSRQNQDEDKDDGNEDEDEEEEEDDEDERNCSCHDNQQESDNIGVFPMGDFDDLDLEQIETH